MSKTNKTLRSARTAFWVMLAISLNFYGANGGNSANGAFAASSPQPQEIKGSNGDLFMEETSAPQTQRPQGNSRVTIINGRNSSTGDSTSKPSSNRPGMFMQEVETPPQMKPRRAHVDLSNVGIPVDPSGNIIPVIDQSNGAVRPLGSNTQVYNEMPVPTINSTVDNPFALPYTMNGQPAAVGTAFVPVTPGTVPFLQPSFNPYNGISTLNPYSASPYSPGFGGPFLYPRTGFYPGYPGGNGFNIGKVHIGLGQPSYGFGGNGLPGYGYPGGGYTGFGYPGYGYQGYGYPGYRAPGLGLGYSGGGYGYPRYGYAGYGSPLGGFNSPYSAYNQGPFSALGEGGGIFLPMPTKSTYTTSSSSSSLMTPVLRDPATSTGDLLEDAKRAGLWSNTAGSGSGFFNRGLIGGSYGGSGEQHDTGVTEGSGLK